MRRIAVKLVVFLFLGAAINVGVAWGCAALMNLMAVESSLLTWTLDQDQGWFVRTWKQPGAAFYASFRSPLLTSGNSPPPRSPHPANIVPNEGALATPASGFGQGSNRSKARGVSLRGWPMLSMWCEYPKHGRGEPVAIAGGIELPLMEQGFREYYPGFRSTWPKALPLRIRAVGFMTNTAFYAALLWLPFAPFAARRMIRRRRGRCVRCGYDLRGIQHDVCPECGGSICHVPCRAGSRVPSS